MKPISPQAYQLLHEGSIALAHIQNNGIRVDTRYLKRIQKETDDKLRELEKELRGDKVYRRWHSRYGSKLKLGSSDQLVTTLVKDFGCPAPKITARKDENDEFVFRYSADEMALRHTEHPFAELYLRWKKTHKLSTTYLRNIAFELQNGFIHPFFNLETVLTYRSSSDRINFQNLPSRDPEIMRIIRSCFIPRKGHRIVELDYKGVEVAVAYCYHKDPVMRKYLLDKSSDMHRDIAIQVYKLGKDITAEYWKDKSEGMGHTVRHSAKNRFVFPAFYGSWRPDIARSLWEAITEAKLKTPDGVPMVKHLRRQGIRSPGDFDPAKRPDRGTFEAHIGEVESDFWKRRFKVYDAWKDQWLEQYRRLGYFQSLTGFIYDSVLSKNKVINYAIQGSAFHCCLWSLTRLQAFLEKNGWKSKIIGQIHDSIVCDVHEDEFDEFMEVAHRIVKEDLMKAWDWIIIPVDVDAEVTEVDQSWATKKSWEWN